MKKFIYSKNYRRKLLEIKKYLDSQFGIEVRKKALRTITDRLHHLQMYEESGVSIRSFYGIDTDYRYVFVAHNYVFYRIADDSIRILSIYNENEDFMLDLFGINSIDETSETYWTETEFEQQYKDKESW